MGIDYAPAQPIRPRLIGKPVAIFVLVSVVALLAAPLWYPYTPAGRQARNMQNAEAYLPTFLPKIRGDARFDAVEANVTTDGDGALFIHGYVRSDADLAALQAITNSAKEKINLVMHVEVEPALADSFAKYLKK